ncbi:MAG: twin-arginine translocation signal domain-containing protein, partial [Armatimonadota bacterium]
MEPNKDNRKKAASSRRSFLKGIGTAGVGVAASLTPLPPLSAASPTPAHGDGSPHDAAPGEAVPEGPFAQAPAVGSEILVPLTLKINGAL